MINDSLILASVELWRYGKFSDEELIRDLKILVSGKIIPICPECGEMREGDARVEEGMKCGKCAYAVL